MTRTYPEIGIRRVSRWIFNTYVVEDGGDGVPFVVDAGLPITGKATYEEFTARMGRRPEELALLTATHAHSDHVAGTPYLHQKTSAPVHLHEKVRDYLAGAKGIFPSARQLLWYRNLVGEQPFDWQALYEFASTGGTEGFGSDPRFKLSCPVAGFLEDGAPLPHAPEWTVLHTPGHTDCSICFWNEKSRTLLTGDTVLTVKGKAWFNPVHANAAKMKLTEERLRSLPVEHLLPGHGKPISGPNIMGEALSFKETMRGEKPLTCAISRILGRG